MSEIATQQQRRGIVVVVAVIFVVTLAVNLQVPLYKSYADLAGYQQGGVSVTFAAYVAGLIPVLLVFGGAGDRFGNKVALVLGLTFALAAHLVIIGQPTMQGLLKMRLLQGVSIGLTLAAATAYLVELGASPKRAARLSGGAVTLGLGGGGLTTSACLAFRHSLVPLSYAVVASATFICLCAVLCLGASRARRNAALLRMPLISARTLPFAAAIFLAWSLTGIILATIPTQLALIGQGQWSGLVVFLAIAVGGLVQLGAEVSRPLRFLRIGYVFGALATLLLVVGVHQRSALLLLLASTLSGFSSFGYTYLGGLTGTLLSCEEERARAVSGYYLLGYIGFGLPCVAVGCVTARWGLEYALLGYASVVGTGLALWRVVRGGRAQASARS